MCNKATLPALEYCEDWEAHAKEKTGGATRSAGASWQQQESNLSD